ncbi:MAG: pyrroloquinoline quinone-dependent dehydrogenase [Gammaproteobacteria bacterium]|jgi:quinoprotein glucose dehydrogenase|nr:pyrroloquinoline quinone-dependent dehydrogenase [Gammaproteobacteria bacterium]
MRLTGLVISVLIFAGFNSTMADEWLVHGGDKQGTRYSSLKQITPGNVDDLELAWQYRTGEKQRRGDEIFAQSKDQNIPLVVAGNLIVCTPFNRVIGLDPASGKERWVFDAEISLDLEEPSTYACRGVAHWRDDDSSEEEACHDRLLFGTNDLRFFAIDARTGKQCAGFGDGGVVQLPPSKPELYRGELQHQFPPAVINDVVVIGSAIGDNQRSDSPSGRVQAFSVRDGSRLWEFDAIPRSEDDPAYDSWGENGPGSAGSGNVWAHMAVDEERDMIFLPVSSPSPDNYGGTRPGNNEYTNSLVALRGSTGEKIWHYQILHHGIWDYDLAPQPLLVDLPRDGVMVPVVVQNTKQGLIFVFHRETGEPFFPIEERPVPQGDVPGEWYSPTQPFPVKPPPLIKLTVTADDMWGFTFWDKGKCRDMLAELRHGEIYTPPSLQGSVISPWTGGGANWGGPAFDPKSGLMIINTSRVMKVSQLVTLEDAEKDTSSDGFHYGPPEEMRGTPYAIKDQLFTSPWGAPCNKPPWGGLTAVDLANGTIKWDVALGSIEDQLPIPIPWNLGMPNIGGPIITAGGVIFIAATMDQNFRAFDIKTGEELWRDKLPATTMTTPITYEANGRQYVVVVSGGHGEVPSVRGDYVSAYALPD